TRRGHDLAEPRLHGPLQSVYSAASGLRCPARRCPLPGPAQAHRPSQSLKAPPRTTRVLKQMVFLRKRPDMTMEQFMDYYENQHSQLAKKLGKPAIPNALRYVRRYVKPEKNPVTGQVHDCGYDCIMEIWWPSRAEFENSQRLISDPARL